MEKKPKTEQREEVRRGEGEGERRRGGEWEKGGEEKERKRGERGGACVVAMVTLLSPPTSYWDSFHSCAATALADCQEGAAELWEQLKEESRSLDIRGSLFELCGGGNGAPSLSTTRGRALLLSLLTTFLTALAF